MHEMERLCVSENACSTPKCSKVVNRNKQIINYGLLIFPTYIERCHQNASLIGMT
jgi:hypothetical protein